LGITQGPQDSPSTQNQPTNPDHLLMGFALFGVGAVGMVSAGLGLCFSSLFLCPQTSP